MQGLLDPSQFKPGCPDFPFKVMVVLLLQEGGGDLWILMVSEASEPEVLSRISRYTSTARAT